MQAQEDTTGVGTTHQIWMDFYPNFYLVGKLKFHGDIGYRTIVSGEKWSRIYARPSLRYNLDSVFVLHGGVGLFLEWSKFTSNRFEVRPWQGVQIKWPIIGRFRFNHLLRVEERINFLYQENVTEYELRFRVRVGGSYHFNKTAQGRSFFVPVYFEWFIPVTGDVEEQFINRTRLSAGLGYNATRILQFRFLVNWQRSLNGTGDGLQSSDWAYHFQARYALDFRSLDDDASEVVDPVN